MPTITINYNPESLPWAEGKDIIINVFSDRIDVDSLISLEYKKSTSSRKILSFIEKEGKRLDENNQRRTSKAYLTAAKCLIEFTGDADIKFSDIDASLMQRFQMYLLARGRNANTISFYLRNIRAVFNKAIKENIIKKPKENPFSNLTTGVYVTDRKALTKREMQKLLKINPKYLKEKEADSLKYFLFCFYARGMSFIDLVFLKKKYIKDDELLYKRKQSDRYVAVKITSAMMEIIDYFAPQVKDSPYLFPFLDSKKDEYSQYNNALCAQNRILKIVSLKARLKKELSTNMARSSWAAIAKEKEVPIPLIAKALDTNEIAAVNYLNTIDTSAIFDISEKITSLVHDMVTKQAKPKSKSKKQKK